MRTFAKGRKAWGICQRSGKRVLHRELVEDGHIPGLLVAPEWWEPKHPQELPPNVDDPVAIYRATPDDPPTDEGAPAPSIINGELFVSWGGSMPV